MKTLSENEGWIALVLFGAFAVSGVMAAVGAMPMWVPWAVWIAFAVLVLRSQWWRDGRRGRGNQDK